MGQGGYGIAPEILSYVSDELAAIHDSGVQLGIVIGAGNIFRGSQRGQRDGSRCRRQHGYAGYM